MKPAVVYIHVPGCGEHQQMATHFVESYRMFPPGHDHQTIIVCQSNPPDAFARQTFAELPKVRYYQHDDSGFDIGGYIAAAKGLKADFMLCLGGSSYFRRAGWLARMVDVWDKTGTGLYGAIGTYEVSPHLSTSGFWCPPKMLAQYPIKVMSKRQRYDFEHGPNALWKQVHARGEIVKLVTWDGEYEWKQWRTPPNIFRRGDQSNCLAYWHHNTKFDRDTPDIRKRTSFHTDTLTDPLWIALMEGEVNGNERQWLEAQSARTFMGVHKFIEAGRPWG